MANQSFHRPEQRSEMDITTHDVAKPFRRLRIVDSGKWD